MSDEPIFGVWMARVRAGDEEAAEQLVRRYERAIRIRVRAMLTDPVARRQLDSVDICQSVLASFFSGAATGQFQLDNSAQLVALLAGMARNKVAMAVRRQQQECRDNRRDVGTGDDMPALADRSPGPMTLALYRDLLHTLLDRLEPDERELAQRRALGQTWAEIAADVGGAADGHRIKLSRALERLAPQLGLLETGEEWWPPR